MTVIKAEDGTFSVMAGGKVVIGGTGSPHDRPKDDTAAGAADKDASEAIGW